MYSWLPLTSPKSSLFFMSNTRMKTSMPREIAGIASSTCQDIGSEVLGDNTLASSSCLGKNKLPETTTSVLGRKRLSCEMEKYLKALTHDNSIPSTSPPTTKLETRDANRQGQGMARRSTGRRALAERTNRVATLHPDLSQISSGCTVCMLRRESHQRRLFDRG